MDRSHYPESAGCHSRDVTDRSHFLGAMARSHCPEATADSRYPEWVDRVTVDPRAAADAGAVAAVGVDWVVAADSAGPGAAGDAAAAAGASNSSVDRTTDDPCNSGPSNRRD